MPAPAPATSEQLAPLLELLTRIVNLDVVDLDDIAAALPFVQRPPRTKQDPNNDDYDDGLARLEKFIDAEAARGPWKDVNEYLNHNEFEIPGRDGVVTRGDLINLYTQPGVAFGVALACTVFLESRGAR